MQRSRGGLLLVSQGKTPQHVAFQMCLGDQEKLFCLTGKGMALGRPGASQGTAAHSAWLELETCSGECPEWSPEGSVGPSYWQEAGHRGFVLHLWYNRKRSKCLTREMTSLGRLLGQLWKKGPVLRTQLGDPCERGEDQQRGTWGRRRLERAGLRRLRGSTASKTPQLKDIIQLQIQKVKIFLKEV